MILWATTQPSDYIRFDLVPANTSFVPDLYGFNTSLIAIPEDELVYPVGNVTFTTILGLENGKLSFPPYHSLPHPIPSFTLA